MTRAAGKGAARFEPNRPAKPMLSRVAESLYWMSRYVERAEHVSRLVLVNNNVLTDIGDMETELHRKLWQGVFQVLHLDEQPDAAALLASADGASGQRLAAYMSFDEENPNSLVSCLTRARENARSIREIISMEMWEALNTLYLSIKGEETRARFDDSPQEVLRQMMSGSFLFQGLTSQTMAHEQGRQLAELAKYLERGDITCRIVETKFEILSAVEENLEAPLKNILSMAVLRSCCAIEGYRRLDPGDVDPSNVALFLILEQHMPRSISYAVNQAHRNAAAVHAGTGLPGPGPAERILARLDAQLRTADPEEVLAAGIQSYLQNVRRQIVLAMLELQKEHFLH